MPEFVEEDKRQVVGRGEINHRRLNAVLRVWFSCPDREEGGRAVSYGADKS